jgi:hypothetical protein
MRGGKAGRYLQDNLPEDQAKDAQTLARQYALNEPNADEKVDELLAGIDLDIEDILKGARGPQIKRTLARVWAARTGRRHAGR